MNSDVLKKALGVIAAFVLSLFLLLNAFFFVTYYDWIYEDQFERLGVAEKLEAGDVFSINRDLIDYLYGQELKNKEYYNEQELSHLRDVRDIFLYLRILYVFLLAVLLPLIYFSSFSKEKLERTVKISTFMTWLSVILFSSIFLSFDKVFYKFHVLVFDNDHWLLDASSSNLINMFPAQFFANTAAAVLVVWLLLSILIYLLILFLKRRANK